MGECFFLYWPTRVVNKEQLDGCVCVCVCVCGISAQQNQGWRTKSHRECSQMSEEHTTAIVRKKSTENGDTATIDQLDSVFPTAAP